jgi:hypothetical protein
MAADVAPNHEAAPIPLPNIGIAELKQMNDPLPLQQQQQEVSPTTSASVATASPRSTTNDSHTEPGEWYGWMDE